MDEMEICEGKSDDTVEIYDDTKKDSSHEVGEVKNRNTGIFFALLHCLINYS